MTGVCGTRNVDLVRSLGADHVVDYRASDFTESGQRYDVILDNVGNKPLADCLRVLAPRGTFMPNSGTSGGSWLGSLPTMGHAAVRSVFSPQKTTTFLSMPNPDDLEALKDLVLSGAVRPVISGTYPLDQAAEAMRVVQSGHTSGKVVVQVAAQGSVAGEPPQPE